MSTQECTEKKSCDAYFMACSSTGITAFFPANCVTKCFFNAQLLLIYERQTLARPDFLLLLIAINLRKILALFKYEKVLFECHFLV